jgi:hypothetical protein
VDNERIMELHYPQSCWTLLRIFPVTIQKYLLCFEVR